jgi:hypothetical protein
MSKLRIVAQVIGVSILLHFIMPCIKISVDSAALDKILHPDLKHIIIDLFIASGIVAIPFVLRQKGAAKK